MEGSILARRDCLTLDNGMRLRLLSALEVLQARREAGGLARAPKEHALCSNACLLARALETEEGSPIFSGGEAVLAGLRVEEIAALADYVYEHVFVHYTMKQWGQTPEEIDPNTTARVPVFLSEDCRYFQDAYQGMPLEGYTPMFQSLLDHPDITVELGVDAASRLTLDGSAALLDGRPFSGPIIYTGAADELFGCKYGRLPYRTLDFRFETHDVEHVLPCGTVNFTVTEDYTRITEFKYLTGQELPGQTTIMKEYSRAYTGAKGEIPYYAIINAGNNALYAKYRAEADRYPNFHLLGRLAVQILQHGRHRRTGAGAV